MRHLGSRWRRDYIGAFLARAFQAGGGINGITDDSEFEAVCATYTSGNQPASIDPDAHCDLVPAHGFPMRVEPLDRLSHGERTSNRVDGVSSDICPLECWE